VLAALYALSDFGAVSLMQYDSLTRAVYLQYRALFDRTPAAVLGLVLVALSAIVLVAEVRLRGSARYHRGSPGAARPAAWVRLGCWRWPALGFAGGVVGFALAVPVAVLGYWFARSPSVEAVWRPALSSVGVSVIAGAVAVAAALPVAILAVRHASPWTRALERASYASNALPGIVIALSLVFFAANYATPVYQTLGLLIVAYVIRFMPQALAGVHAALLRVDPHLEEAARGLGHRPRAVLRRVTVPLLGSGLLAGATLVFLSTMKELPATLLLRPIGFDTLATEVWRKTAVAAYSEAAVPALLLMAVSAPLVYFLVARDGPRADAHG
jgi:iron(III) transport system permease protein